MNQELDYLQVMYTNADSIVNEMYELLERVNVKKPHIIVITEVNPKRQQYLTKLVIDGYILFSSLDEKKWGISILIKNHLNLVEARKLPTHGVQEVIAAEAKLHGADKQTHIGHIP